MQIHTSFVPYWRQCHRKRGDVSSEAAERHLMEFRDSGDQPRPDRLSGEARRQIAVELDEATSQILDRLTRQLSRLQSSDERAFEFLVQDCENCVDEIRIAIRALYDGTE